MAFKRTTKELKPHLIVDAGPGCGKTSTVEGGIGIITGNPPSWISKGTPEQLAIWESMKGDYQSIAVVAFNKSIAMEMESRLPSTVDCMTFHKLGLKMLTDNGYKFRISGDATKIRIKTSMGYELNARMSRPDFFKSLSLATLIGTLKNELLEPDAATIKMIAQRDDNKLVCDIKTVSLIKQVMDDCKSIEKGKPHYIDFDDMIWLPLILDLAMEASRYDLLVIDELQDCNAVQHQMILRCGDRIIGIGDKRQSIYGFRGADCKSMETISTYLSGGKREVLQMPLLTSFRLPKSGVANIQSYAPDLRSTEHAIEGEIKHQTVEEITPQPGDLIISRVNGNIFGLAFKLLKSRVAVRIQGREFGGELSKIISKRCYAHDSIEKAQVAIRCYDEEEMERLSKKQFNEALVANHIEKIACLYSLMYGCSTVQEMLDTISELFDNNIPRENVVLLSTIHRAKGLEADNVYFLEPNLVPHKMAKKPDEIEQEYNLKFVAESRHKHTLTYVLATEGDERDNVEGEEPEAKYD